jgi:DNA-binding PadR family transcriptional regulator
MILGLVRWLQPVHGYDVRRELLSWDVESWANIQPGSIYHALRKLSEEGLLAEVATEQVGGRPARTTYRVTEEGEREFAKLLREYWWEYKPPVDPFMPAFAFLPSLRREESVAALRSRADGIERASKAVREEMATAGWLDDRPVHVGWHIDLMLVRRDAEVRWCRDVADRIEAGEGQHEDCDYDVAEAGERWRQSIAERFGGDVDESDVKQ